MPDSLLAALLPGRMLPRSRAQPSCREGHHVKDLRGPKLTIFFPSQATSFSGVDRIIGPPSPEDGTLPSSAEVLSPAEADGRGQKPSPADSWSDDGTTTLAEPIEVTASGRGHRSGQPTEELDAEVKEQLLGSPAPGTGSPTPQPRLRTSPRKLPDYNCGPTPPDASSGDEGLIQFLGV